MSQPVVPGSSHGVTGPAAAVAEHPPLPLHQVRSVLSRGPATPGYFFFAANRRSGTTWLAAMLSSHPEVMIKNEGWLFNDGPGSIEHWLSNDAFNAFLELPSAKGQWLHDIPESDARLLLVRAMAEALMLEGTARTAWKNPDRVKMIGDKTTTHLCTKAELVHRLFPDGRYLHMVRDGRDVVVSDMFLKFAYKACDEFEEPAAREAAWAAYRFHALGEGEPVPLFTRGTLMPFIETWKASIAGAHRAKSLYPERQFCEVRYETLKERPHEEMARIFSFLGVSTTEALINNVIAENTFERHSGGRKPGEANALNPTRKGVVGDWKNYFTDECKAMFKEAAGPLLVELGYERDENW